MISATARNLIDDYLQRGWRLLLLDPKSKATHQAGWPESAASAADLVAHLALSGNIGVIVGEPSGHLVDVDLDCSHAVAAASAFLPPTGLIHGRPSKPASHYWYTASGIKTAKFYDVPGTDGKQQCLLELRGTGTQTVLPPSVHPTGEVFAWNAEGDPANVSSDALRSAVVALAACVLMARHWPSNGARHDASLALAGMLLSAGWSVDVTSRLIVQAAKLAGDEEYSQRRRDVDTTDKRLAAGEPVTGAGRLASIVGDNVVAMLRQWLGIEAGAERSTSAILRPLTSLSNPATPEAIEAALRRVATSLDGSDQLRRTTVREAALVALDTLGVSSPARLVVGALKSQESEDETKTPGQGRPITFPAIEPWPDPVDGTELLDELASTFRRFVALPKHSDDALSLWTVFTHTHDLAFISPYIGLTSPIKRCGKTTTLSVLGQLVTRPLLASNVSGPAIYRVVDAYSPTLLIDEGDTFLPRNDEVRGILNSGHTRPMAFVVKCVGDDSEPRYFSTWAPKAIALIGGLPDTLEDRSIVVPHRRRALHEPVTSLDLEELTSLEPLRRRIARWVADHTAALGSARPKAPEGLHDRAANNWRPLLGIADVAGGDWPARAREAASVLSGDAEERSQPWGVQLLSDVRDILSDCKDRGMSTDMLLGFLNSLGDRPWPTINRGKVLDGRRLANLLKPFGIKPKLIRLDVVVCRGYEKADFEDAWDRYLPPHAASVTDTGRVVTDDVTPNVTG